MSKVKIPRPRLIYTRSFDVVECRRIFNEDLAERTRRRGERAQRHHQYSGILYHRCIGYILNRNFGIDLSMPLENLIRGPLTALKVKPGSYAEVVGIQTGDYILAINGISLMCDYLKVKEIVESLEDLHVEDINKQDVWNFLIASQMCYEHYLEKGIRIKEMLQIAQNRGGVKSLQDSCCRCILHSFCIPPNIKCKNMFYTHLKQCIHTSKVPQAIEYQIILCQNYKVSEKQHYSE